MIPYYEEIVHLLVCESIRNEEYEHAWSLISHNSIKLTDRSCCIQAVCIQPLNLCRPRSHHTLSPTLHQHTLPPSPHWDYCLLPSEQLLCCIGSYTLIKDEYRNKYIIFAVRAKVLFTNVHFQLILYPEQRTEAS